MRKKLVIIVLAFAAVIFVVSPVWNIGNLELNGAVRAFKRVLDVIIVRTDGKENIMVVPNSDVCFVWWSSDAHLYVDPVPFIDAGLDIEQIPKSRYISFTNKMYGYSNVFWEYGEEITPDLEWTAIFVVLDEFKTLVDKNRSALNYHAALDLYSLDFGGGDMFMWAKDMSANDMDVVFALNPEPLINAGVDPAKVDGWVYEKVQTKGGELYKFLKAYNLK
ncbi:MAG: hypothetical protein LBN30_07705 [Oscillospiraceae bacterium]|jgi:hypothetical protein|nr:hypothetical protein [Oscillospiraceae bacterium]